MKPMTGAKITAENQPAKIMREQLPQRDTGEAFALARVSGNG
jgi:hypothetical protein